MDEFSQAIIVDHVKNPRFSGLINPDIFSVKANNPLCGDEVEAQILYRDEGKISFQLKARGCMMSQASSSMVFEACDGKPWKMIEQIRKTFESLISGREISNEEKALLRDLIHLDGIQRFPTRLRCVTLPFEALWSGYNVVSVK